MKASKSIIISVVLSTIFFALAIAISVGVLFDYRYPHILDNHTFFMFLLFSVFLPVIFLGLCLLFAFRYKSGLCWFFTGFSFLVLPFSALFVYIMGSGPLCSYTTNQEAYLLLDRKAEAYVDEWGLGSVFPGTDEESSFEILSYCYFWSEAENRLFISAKIKFEKADYEKRVEELHGEEDADSASSSSTVNSQVKTMVIHDNATNTILYEISFRMSELDKERLGVG